MASNAVWAALRLAAVALVVLAFAGCAGSAEQGPQGAATATGAAQAQAAAPAAQATVPLAAAQPEQSVPPAGQDTAQAEPPAVAPAVASSPQAPEAQSQSPAGEGDEEGIRVPAAFSVSGKSVSPSPVTVPPALPVELSVTVADDIAHTLVFNTSQGPVTINVAAGQTVVQMIEGQPRGAVSLVLDGGAPQTALNVADEAGP